MQFAKDILLIDFEATGNKPATDQPVQLAALLLDKNTLEEKKTFVTKIKADLSLVTEDYVKQVLSGFTQDELNSSPDIAEAGRMFVNTFGLKDYLISAWVMNLDARYLEKTLSAAGYNFNDVDYHHFDLFPVVYTHLVKNGYTGGLRTNDIYSFFGVPERTGHDALEDCRISADILRKVLVNA